MRYFLILVILLYIGKAHAQKYSKVKFHISMYQFYSLGRIDLKGKEGAFLHILNCDFNNFNYDTIITTNIEIIKIEDCINLDERRLIKFLSQFNNLKELTLKDLKIDYVDSLILNFKSLRYLDIHSIGLKEFPYSLAYLDKLYYFYIYDDFIFNNKKAIRNKINIGHLKILNDKALREFIDYFSNYNKSLLWLDILSDTLTALPSQISKFKLLENLIVFSPKLFSINLDYLINKDKDKRTVNIFTESWNVPFVISSKIRKDIFFGRVTYVRDDFNMLDRISKFYDLNYAEQGCGISFKNCSTPYEAKYHWLICGIR